MRRGKGVREGGGREGRRGREGGKEGGGMNSDDSGEFLLFFVHPTEHEQKRSPSLSTKCHEQVRPTS